MKIQDFALKGKIFARKAAIYAKEKNYADAIDFYGKSLVENNDSKVRDELNKIKLLKKDKDTLDYLNPELAEQENDAAKEFFQAGSYK